jgi:ribonuclease HI
MLASTPHYLLFAEANRSCQVGRWRFSLRTVDGNEKLQADDIEPGLSGERLDLLTVVRALEALDQPSKVTLVDCSEYIRRGVSWGLPEWRGNGWQWEAFGQMVPVKNRDLWQRMDRAMQFHQLECSRRRFDGPHTAETLVKSVDLEKNEAWGLRVAALGWVKCRMAKVAAAWRRVNTVVRLCRQLIADAGKPQVLVTARR